MISRRDFLRHGALTTAAFLGLQRLGTSAAQGAAPGFGPLQPDPHGVLALPRGFSYRIISSAGQRMDDGLNVPEMADGMAAFPGDNGETLLVRNHENEQRAARPAEGAFGEANELFGKIDPRALYDGGAGDAGPVLGGTTTLAYDTAARRTLRQHLSLAGTERNCAGGPTPWGSWITCEETAERADGAVFARNHGYCFEVPARGKGLAEPAPLEAMGRFMHEAVAVDPASGTVSPDGSTVFFNIQKDGLTLAVTGPWAQRSA